MSINDINTCSHSYNNNLTKQKSCPTIILNPIYKCSKKFMYQKINHLYIYLLIYESTSHVH